MARRGIQTPPRILWRRLQESALALSQGRGSAPDLFRALADTNGVRFPASDNRQKAVAGRLVKLCERWGRTPPERRDDLLTEMAELSARVGGLLDDIWPRPHYRADIDG